MLRDLLQKNQSDSAKDDKEENRNPVGDKSAASPTQPHKDDEDFVPVSHEDVEDVDDDDNDESEMERVLRPFLGLHRQGQRNRGVAANKYDNLHPYTQILSLSDVEACVSLENATFPEHERCSREKASLAPSLNLDSIPLQHKSWLPSGAIGHVLSTNQILEAKTHQYSNLESFPVIGVSSRAVFCVHCCSLALRAHHTMTRPQNINGHTL